MSLNMPDWKGNRMLTLNLKGRIALVTGATGQLGRVMARTLASCGADVALHCRSNRGMAEQLAEEICDMGVKTVVVQADVGNLAEVKAMAKAIGDTLGMPDITVANAVSQYKWTTVLEQDSADYEDQFRTCVLQSVHLAKAFVPAMQAKGWGRFIGINTECSMQNFPMQSAYVAGKRGMDGIYRILAKEIGASGITVNQIAPGWTISARDREEGTEISGSYSATVPLRRRGTDQEIANVVAFLASDLSSFITGAYVPVAGGNVMPSI
jgi:3-oxoacyl-[acyl-carrier protein] reductase